MVSSDATAPSAARRTRSTFRFDPGTLAPCLRQSFGVCPRPSSTVMSMVRAVAVLRLLLQPRPELLRVAIRAREDEAQADEASEPERGITRTFVDDQRAVVTESAAPPDSAGEVSNR